MSENALMVRDEMTLAETMTLGQTMAASGFFDDAREAAQAVVKILAGRELGFGPVASMTGIYIVRKRVCLSANLMAAAIKRDARYNYKVAKHDAEICSIVFFEGGEIVGTSTFTREDAAKAGLGGDSWSKYPRNMLFARAMSNGARWYCPDAFGGGPVYTPEELGATVDESGGVLDVPSRDVTPEQRATIDASAELDEARREAESVDPEPPAERPPVLGLEDADLDYVPEWIDTDQPRQWGRLYFEARRLGFSNDFHVQGALAKVYNLDKWDASEAPGSYREAWHLLQNHQRSKVEEAGS